MTRCERHDDENDHFQRLIRLDQDPIAAAADVRRRLGQATLSPAERAVGSLVLAYALSLSIDPTAALRALDDVDASGVVLSPGLACLAALLRAHNRSAISGRDRSRDALDAALAQVAAIADGGARAFLQECAAWALLRTFNDHAASHELFNASHAHWRARGVAARCAATLSGLAAIHERHRNGAASIAMRQEALAMLGADQPFLDLCISFAVAQDALYAGDDELAWRMYARSRDCSVAIDDLVGIAIADLGLARIAVRRRDDDACLALCRSAWPVLDRHGCPLLARACRAMGAVALARSRPAQMADAVALVEAALSGLDDADLHAVKRSVLEDAAEVYEAAGRPGAAAAVLRRLLALERRLAAEDRRSDLVALQLRHDLERKERDRLELQARLGQQTAAAHAMERLAMEDPLTGAPNRRKIFLDVAQARARQPHGVWLAILDIDHFKAFNDRFGHKVGDDVLCQFHTLARSALPERCLLGRLGGEEWLLCIVDADRVALGDAFTRVRDALAGARLPAGTRLHFSMGCAALGAGDTIETCLARADKALYWAKEEGRDRWRLDDAPGAAAAGGIEGACLAA